MSTPLSKNFLPDTVEEKWYQHWMDKGYFNSTPDDRPPYAVVIPPPNVTGVLHMGHTLNETVQDVLVRKARMSGFNACWVPGSDHASIATEAKVVQMLEKEKGISKHQLTREEFLKHAFEWKEKYGGIIYHQIKKLGCSVDWNRMTFTMDDHYYKAVIKVFVDLFNKGMIYRGARMINWDPAAQTALSDEEVEYKDVQGKLYYVKYLIKDDGSQMTDDSTKTTVIRHPSSVNYIVIATQRPETIMGDTAVCVNPNDERYQHLKGAKVIVPLVNREVPIIFDEYVDPAFGTGALKVTPAHDINDYNLGLKHNLPAIDTLNPDGTLSEAAEVFVGMDRFEARKAAIEKLREEGLLVKEEEYQTRLGFSQRTAAVVEPRISTQWFVKMRDMAGKALDAVASGEVKIHPEERFLATYKYWLENVKDWCISRQLWWGQRIPAWYDESGRFVVAETKEEAVKQFEAAFNTQPSSLTQDEDVLDTWFSSWLWPIEVFNGITQPDNEDIRYYYPTSVLVTGQDIIFFWVARMIMAGEEYMNEKPFEHVYFTGMVRDKQGRKMSKQLGNSPDLLELIQKFGADAVRFGILISAPAGNDLLFDDSSCEQGRNFNNKIWNALKLVKMWTLRQAQDDNQLASGNEQSENFAVNWFENRLNQVKAEVEGLYKGFRLSEALKTIYSLIWDDFCSWYLEWIKPGFEQPIEASVYQKTVSFFEQLMQLLHPFMPFVTEEIYHRLKQQTDDLCIKQIEPADNVDESVLKQGDLLKQIITGIRDVRARNNIKPKDAIKLHVQAEKNDFDPIENILKKQANTNEIFFVNEAVPNSVATVIGGNKFFVETEQQLDTLVQKETLQKELDYQKGFLLSVEKKLSNERFVQNAKPEVVEAERKKGRDAQEKIKALEESLANLS
ncbi:valine--tRNA ligase [Flavisolibacter ginsenosidimutans]|uniref:Valine--tRNA ligase n=1 Tax=Flavisolibacter ginsenosidimutans TaxID=661481 RepID=A0A5B8UDY4_9BACT|nr:valine--tRNA ligase [Flavisolibacter ginsenosidimutans]QEC54728.1 valine--tRNA ligase [Flavisolibacter ginsenosidimutans]